MEYSDLPIKHNVFPKISFRTGLLHLTHTHTFRYQTSCLLSWWFMQPSSVLKKSGAEFIHCTQNLSVSALDDLDLNQQKIR